MLITFDDMLDHVLGYAGMDAGASATVLHRRAIQNAYQVIPSRHMWTYLLGIARVTTNGGYTTGTVQYQYTGGAYERVVTLTGGTWPSWAAYGTLVIANIPYQVEALKSSTEITIVATQASTTDVAAGATFTLYRDRYEMPSDFLGGDEAVVNEIGSVLTYMHPRDWSSQRRVNVGPGQPWAHTYLGSNVVRGGTQIALWPPPDATYAIDILYRKKMRPLLVSQVKDGLVSTSTVTVTGVGTAFKASMIGSIIRFGADNKTIPTGQVGGNPCQHEATITAVTSATVLTIDTAPATDFASVKYLISDPIDIDVGVMYEYFLRECEKQWRAVARSKVKDLNEEGEYTLSLTQAREADNRDFSRAAAMRKQSRRSGFIHYPINFIG